MIAVLFADADGVYSGRDDVDLWDVSRDARLYAGPWPVVAHPPCERWGNLFWTGGSRRRGDDGGCFLAALDAVRAHGGVIEHPAGSYAWTHFGLPVPTFGDGWTRGLFDPGWSCAVDQGRYGHRAQKRTWLYFVGENPPPLDWRESTEHTHYITNIHGVSHPEMRARGLRWLPKRERRATPPPFATLLLSLARNARVRGAA